MHGSPLTSNECVSTMLSYYDRQIATGLPRDRAIAVTAEHFHIAVFKVELFVAERMAATEELLSFLPAPEQTSHAA